MVKTVKIPEAQAEALPSESKAAGSLKSEPGISKKLKRKKAKTKLLELVKKRQDQKNKKKRVRSKETLEESQTSKRENNDLCSGQGKEDDLKIGNQSKNIGKEKQDSGRHPNLKQGSKQEAGLGKEPLNKPNKKNPGGLEVIPKKQVIQGQSGVISKKQVIQGQSGQEPGEVKNENLGGLIFMCNAKTKPDCFQYRVMAVTLNKKDIVLSVKPGLLLFLYDYDLRLLHGIYEASSAGGLRLEPKAFQGAFPAQVRFTVHEDFNPLPERIFRKAIMEDSNNNNNNNSNYNNNNKLFFKTELTVKQVKKLKLLFRQNKTFHSTAPAPRYSPRAMTHNGQARETLPHLHKDPYPNYAYGDGKAAGYTRLPLEMDQRIARSDFDRGSFLSEKDYRSPFGTAPREPVHHDLHFLPENEYQVYGAGSGARPGISAPVPSVTQAAQVHHEPHSLTENEYRAYGLGAGLGLPARPPSVTRATPVYREPRYLTENEYGTYGPGAGLGFPAATEAVPLGSYQQPQAPYSALQSSAPTPYYPQEYGASSAGLYRREEAAVGSLSYSVGDLGRRQYGQDPLADYGQGRRYLGQRSEGSSMPVSSRYAFGGL